MPKTSEPSGYIDPLELARFLVLPRVPELLQAFASIPPGRLRDTIIEHAQALAEAHQQAPPQYRQPDPLAGVLGRPEAPKALPRRTTAEPPTTGDPKTTAVKMRLDGALPYQIAEATGLKIHAVYGAISEARKAGVKFPSSPRAKKGLTKHQGTFAMAIEQITSDNGRATSARAAEARGISLEAYMLRRKTAVEMAIDGRHIRAIMEASKESKAVLGQWFNAARAAGYPVPYMLDALPGHFEDANVKSAAPVVDLGAERQWRQSKKKHKASGRHDTFTLSEDRASTAGLVMVDRAAKAMGLTRAQYFAARAEAVVMFETGSSPAKVAAKLRITHKQAMNWKTRATAAGLLSRKA